MKTLLINSNRKTLARINLEERIKSFYGLQTSKYQIHCCDLINILLLIKKVVQMNSVTTTLKYNPQVFISSHIYKQKPPHHPQHPPHTPAFTFPLSPNTVKGSEATPVPPFSSPPPAPPTRTPGASDRTSQPTQHSATGHPETSSDVTSWLSSEYKKRWDFKKNNNKQPQVNTEQ